MTDRTRFVIVLATAPVLAYTLLGGLLGRVAAQDEVYRHLRIFEDVVSLVTSNYVEEVEPSSIVHGAIWGMAEGLDPQSSYLTEDEVQLYDDPVAGSGVGLELTRRYYVQVVAAREGSPAARAGLAPGDYLREIDGESTRVMSTVRANALLHGAAGSTVNLSIIRENAAEPIDISLIRGDAKSANLTSRIVAPGVGYLRIAEFDDTTASAIQSSISALETQGATRLLIDLRGTATGDFDAGLAMAELFIDGETLAIRKTAAGQEPIARRESSRIGWPVVLLTNPGTAGAAELFAAALIDAERAEAVGTRTAGRASEQNLVRLPDGSGLLLSTMQYLTASGESIHRQGLTPTLVVQEPPATLTTTLPQDNVPQDDPILDRALEHITNPSEG